ncbi:hypothetical protein E3983_11610 [Legionella israelensis]|uniref:FAD-dependent urate hydroxylase HpyO/Asp monooxygenase CreE-like FAD/NAD(P)-binding domain-containing protein n=2 Tax=Legionella israelensis TaxID=454 RepID=A0AAX1EIC6_9GAMM|nr:hypothetical protein E3983_11610 [Legionella israelensis]
MVFMERKEEISSKVIKVCIVGAGPSGLAMAMSLLEEAKKHPSKQFEIHIIEKRDFDFKRRQKLIIIPYRQAPYTSYLKSIGESLRWDDFCQKAFDPEHQLTVDDSGHLLRFNKEMKKELNEQQKFLRRVLRQPEVNTPFFKSPKNFSIKTLQKALKEYLERAEVRNAKIDWHPETVVEKINVSGSSISVTETKTNHMQALSFDYLIVCEGERREVVNLINKEMNAEDKFKYQALGKKSYHMAVRLTVKSATDGDYRKFLKEQRKLYEEEEGSIYEAAEALGWHSSGYDDPVYILDTNLYKESLDDKRWRPRLFVASEIPESLYDIQDEQERRKKILEWSTIFASRLMRIPRDCFEIDTKEEDTHHKLNAVAFISDIHYVDNPIRQLSSGSYILLIGDCAISAHYPLGFSSTIAMNEARIAAECMVDDKAEIEDCFHPLNNKYQAYVTMFKKMLGPRPLAADNLKAEIRV